MKIERNEDYEPVCKFGPGGDFVRGWPPSTDHSTLPLRSGLGQVLASLSLIINKMRHQQQFEGTMNEPRADAGELIAVNPIAELSTEKAHDESTTDATTDPVGQTDSQLSDEPLLFADDIRVSERIRPKPKHHVRAHRRTPKKRHSVCIAGQGSLFDADLQSAKIA